MRKRLRILLLSVLVCLAAFAAGCNLMPDEEPGYDIRVTPHTLGTDLR